MNPQDTTDRVKFLIGSLMLENEALKAQLTQAQEEIKRLREDREYPKAAE